MYEKFQASKQVAVYLDQYYARPTKLDVDWRISPNPFCEVPMILSDLYKKWNIFPQDVFRRRILNVYKQVSSWNGGNIFGDFSFLWISLKTFYFMRKWQPKTITIKWTTGETESDELLKSYVLHGGSLISIGP